jgi:hypothetical protein
MLADQEISVTSLFEFPMLRDRNANGFTDSCISQARSKPSAVTLTT